MPTLAELAGGPKVPVGINGISFAPTLLGKAQPERPFLYREFAGYQRQKRIHVGDWTPVRQKLMPRGNAVPVIKTELYNLKDDLAETSDVSAEYPAVVARLARLMRDHRTSSVEFPIPILDN